MQCESRQHFDNVGPKVLPLGDNLIRPRNFANVTNRSWVGKISVGRLLRPNLLWAGTLAELPFWDFSGIVV